MAKGKIIAPLVMVLALAFGFFSWGIADAMADEESDSANPAVEVSDTASGLEADGAEKTADAAATAGEGKPDSEKPSSGEVASSEKDRVKADTTADSANEDASSPLRAPSGGDSDAVASVGGTKYPTLQKAIDAAADGDTVVLLADRTESITIGKAITLDLGGKTLSTSTSGTENPTVTVKDGKIATIKNGTIVGGEAPYTSSPSAINVSSAGVNLEGVAITGCSGYGVAIVMSAYSDLGEDLHFTNVTVSGTKAQVIWGGVKNNISFTSCRFDNNLPEGTNRLVALGGRGNKAFTDCTFQNNKAQGIADTEGTFTNCIFTGNEVGDGAVISADDWGDEKVVLVNTVVKDNTCTSEYGVAGVSTYELELDGSAVYNNTNSAGGRTDLGEHCSDIDVTTMKDPTDPSMDFSEYGVDDKGTVKHMAPTFEAEIGDTKYKTLKEAVEAANDGDIIKIINTNEVGDVKAIAVNSLWIQKDLTIDLNGRDVSSDGWSFCLADATGKLSLVNSSEDTVSMTGSIFNYDVDCSVTVGDKIEVEDWLWHNQNTILDGVHGSLYLLSNEDLNGGKTMPVTFGGDFKFTSADAALNFSLAESKDELNDSETEVDDILIAHGATADLVGRIKLSGITNPLVRAVFKPIDRAGETGDLVVHKDVATCVYLNGVDGDDANDGTTKDDAVKTFERAKSLAESLVANGKNVVVYITGTVTADSDSTWKFDDPEKVTVFRDADFDGNMVKVSSSGKLTLTNIVIDGNKANADAGKNSLIEVSGGTLNLGSGSVLQNNELTDLDAYPPSAGGAVYADGEPSTSMAERYGATLPSGAVGSSR